LVTMIDEPVSAIRKFAPVMPTSAARNFSRSTPRASSAVRGLTRCGLAREAVWLRRKVGLDLLLVEVDGRRDDVEGGSPRSWMMYSPRSVSTGSMPFGLERVVERDLLGDHRLALGDGPPRPRADAEDGLARLGGGAAPVDMPAGARTFSS
jgi:hypothetical protein